MASNVNFRLISWKELLFQVVLHVLVFIFYTFDKRHPEIELHQIVFFLNYLIAAGIINYVLLPYFFYKKKYVAFLGFVLLILASLIIIEELVLEPYFFPNSSRAESFPGVLYTLLHILPVMAILTGFKFAWDAIGKQKELETLRASVHESELQFLKSQINPHFLFNNLNNLYSYAIEQSAKTPTIILELSSVLRYMLYDCKERYVPLSKEVEHLRNFTRLYELQIEDRGNVEFTTENISDSYRIAPLILGVFIENAFKHSTASQSSNIGIQVTIKVNAGGMLHFTCENSFERQTNTDDVPHGIGLQNVKKRLELLYPQHDLQIDQGQNLYKVSLIMQLNGGL